MIPPTIEEITLCGEYRPVMCIPLHASSISFYNYGEAGTKDSTGIWLQWPLEYDLGRMISDLKLSFLLSTLWDERFMFFTWLEQSLRVLQIEVSLQSFCQNACPALLFLNQWIVRLDPDSVVICSFFPDPFKSAGPLTFYNLWWSCSSSAFREWCTRDVVTRALGTKWAEQISLSLGSELYED